MSRTCTAKFTLILDAGATDSVATIGFNSLDCDADFTEMVARGAIVLEQLLRSNS